MINLSFVRTFVCLADTGGFSAAARTLGLSQPTVSQHLRKLEDALGAQLVDRGSSGCTLTVRGRSLLPYAKTLLQSAERFTQAAETQTLTIGCSGNIAAYFISPALKTFMDEVRPALRWSIHTDSNPALVDALRTGSIDVAAMEWPAEEDGIQTHAWRQEDLVVIAPPGHPLAGKRQIEFGDLVKLDLIGGESGSGTASALRQAFGVKANRLRIAHHLHSTEAVKSAVRAGLGCSVVLRRAVADDIAAGRLAELAIRDTKITKTFHLSAGSDIPASAPAARLIGFMKAA